MSTQCCFLFYTSFLPPPTAMSPSSLRTPAGIPKLLLEVMTGVSALPIPSPCKHFFGMPCLKRPEETVKLKRKELLNAPADERILFLVQRAFSLKFFANDRKKNSFSDIKWKPVKNWKGKSCVNCSARWKSFIQDCNDFFQQ